MKYKILLSVMLSSVFVVNSYAETSDSASSSAAVVSSTPDFSAIYDSVGKSVVNINVTQDVTPQANPFGNSGDPMFDYFFKRMLPPQQKYKQRGLGSGFIISKDGYILTNAHVVSNADTVTVKLSDKREFKAKVIGSDQTSDVALIKINANNLPVAKIGDPTQMKPGNWVVAIGSPFGLDNTITQGIISAMSRNLPDDSSVPYIQSDVPINPGNSGGPLINLKGEIIGVNSQIYSKSGGYMGISFSIPIDYAVRIADQLKATGKVVHGRLGIAIQPVTEALAPSFGLPANSKGAIINSVDAGSAAEKAGLQIGDVILKANGQDIVDTAQLPQIVSNLGPNKKVEMVIWRNNKKINITAITMAANDNQNPDVSIAGQSSKTATKSLSKLGITISALSNNQLKQLGGKIKGGLVIQDATTDAQFAGISVGDVIVGVANTPVTTIAQLENIVNRARPGQTIALKVLRSNGQQFMTLFIPMTVTNAAGN